MNQQQRFMACKRWRWLTGASAIDPVTGVKWMLTHHQWQDWEGRTPDYSNGAEASFDRALPDLTDPATIGCILALVREAWGDPYLHCEFYPAEQGQPDLWMVMTGHRQFVGATEAEALLVALEAAPTLG